MINICYEQRIGDFFVPNGMPIDVVEEMKRLENPKYVFVSVVPELLDVISEADG